MIRLKFPRNYRCCNLPRIIKSDIDIVSWYVSSSSSSKYWKSKSWRGNSNRHREVIEAIADRRHEAERRAFCERKSIGTWAANSPSLVSSWLPAYKVQKTAPTSFHVCVCERNREARGGETEERTLLPVRSARRRDHFNTRQVSLCDIQRVILPPFDIQSLSIRSRNDGFRTSLWTWRSFEYP